MPCSDSSKNVFAAVRDDYSKAAAFEERGKLARDGLLVVSQKDVYCHGCLPA
jgi:hypothetical protein